jgi:ABC-type phosphate transport system substrate-binding protein
MKKTLAGALFVALGAAATGAGALDNIALQGSDTLKPLTIQVLAACPAAAGLTYPGGGSGAGEGALKAGTQTVAPMSRFLAAANACAFNSGNPVEAEALQVGLDAISIVIHQSHRTACDPDSPPTGAACTKDVETGLRYSDGTAPLTCVSNGAAVTINDWKAVLRLIYFGLTPKDVGACKLATSTECTTNAECPGAGDSCVIPSGQFLTDRDCSDPCRVELVNNWSKLFQNACSGGECTQLRHAFRRDENSGTTDAFRDLLSVRGTPDFVADGNKGFPFCNELDAGANDVPAACPPLTVAGAVAGSPGLSARPYLELYQDQDPIRRTALGTGALALDLKTPPPVAPTEQVASAKGDLGLVLPISVPPLVAGSVSNNERHARIGTQDRAGTPVPTQYCTRGFFKLGAAPSIAAVAPASTVCAPGPAYALCPDGDVPKGACFDNTLKIAIGGTGLCPYPVFDADASVATTNDQDFRCINGQNNRPAISTGTNQMNAAIKAACVATNFDGRVYNLHPHNAAGNYITQTYNYSGGAVGVPLTGSRPVVGAFYRIHETRTAVTGSADCAGDTCCALDDSTDQIGCLVAASPCSLGFAGENSLNQTVATTPVQSVYGSSLNGVEKAQACVLSNAYPLSRFLYLSTLAGFTTAPGGVSGDELELAKCYSGNGLSGTTISSLVAGEGFQVIPIGCKSFDETSASAGCNGTAPASNSCSNNPAGVAALLGIGEACSAGGACATGICTSGKCAL